MPKLSHSMPYPIHPMKKAFFLLATLLLTSPAALLSADAIQPGKPNILFIMADDFGWTDLGCYGSKYHQTPNLDKIAARGVKFTQAYAANPLCSPTRSSVLTGLWPARTGITAPVCHLPQLILDKQLSTIFINNYKVQGRISAPPRTPRRSTRKI